MFLSLSTSLVELVPLLMLFDTHNFQFFTKGFNKWGFIIYLSLGVKEGNQNMYV